MALMARNRGEKITAAASWPARDLGKMVSVLTGGVHLSVEENKIETVRGLLLGRCMRARTMSGRYRASWLGLVGSGWPFF